MIRLRTDLANSFCCDPPNAINRQTSNNVLSTSDKRVEENVGGDGLVSRLALVFMTTSAAEATAIDNGPAGPGWTRTA